MFLPEHKQTKWDVERATPPTGTRYIRPLVPAVLDVPFSIPRFSLLDMRPCYGLLAEPLCNFTHVFSNRTTPSLAFVDILPGSHLLMSMWAAGRGPVRSCAIRYLRLSAGRSHTQGSETVARPGVEV